MVLMLSSIIFQRQSRLRRRLKNIVRSVYVLLSSKYEDIVRLFNQTVEHFGQLDIVFSNARIEHWDKPDEVDESRIDHVCFIDINYSLKDNGRLILMSSLSAQRVRLLVYVLYINNLYDLCM
jgi:NAD(P)-dependent dehydrogenase (short-subunit alcohol dehydrogenase family)